MAVDFEELYDLPTINVKKLLNITPSVYWISVKPFWTKLHKHYKQLKKEK